MFYHSVPQIFKDIQKNVYELFLIKKQ